MDEITAVLMLFVLLVQVLILRRLARVEDKIRAHNTLLEGFRTRQGRLAGTRTTQATPRIDSKARTTRRDTADLPTTGRQSMGVHRVRSNGGRIDSDSEL